QPGGAGLLDEPQVAVEPLGVLRVDPGQRRGVDRAALAEPVRVLAEADLAQAAGAGGVDKALEPLERPRTPLQMHVVVGHRRHADRPLPRPERRTVPPSTTRVWPVIVAASSETGKPTALATASEVPTRRTSNTAPTR